MLFPLNFLYGYLFYIASRRGGGAGSVVDNLHADGAQYPIDVDTGCIVRGSVKYNGEKTIRYHPSTGTKMIGMQIPNWNKILTTLKETGKIPTNVRYIGWDIAVTEDGCKVIEANYKQGRNGMQQDDVGKNVIKKFLCPRMRHVNSFVKKGGTCVTLKER